jgi:Co/Zn/Cd efflux system component
VRLGGEDRYGQHQMHQRIDNTGMADSCCNKELDTSSLQNRQRRVLIAVLVINAATFVMMIGAAIMSGSSALISGALDNLGDAVTYAISFAVVGASTQAKARVALFKGLLIMSAAIAVAVQIGWRLMHMETPIFETMGIAAILNLLPTCCACGYSIRIATTTSTCRQFGNAPETTWWKALP